MDAFTVLALLVPATKTVRLGTGVTTIPYRHPLEMARVVASLDVASGGRVIFGAGVGWMADECDLLGVPQAERAARTREHIAVMREVRTNETPRIDGKCIQINRDLHFAPKPAQKPHPPIRAGGASTPALKRVVGLGQGWHIGPLPLKDVQHRFDKLRQLMEAGGITLSWKSLHWLPLASPQRKSAPTATRACTDARDLCRAQTRDCLSGPARFQGPGGRRVGVISPVPGGVEAKWPRHPPPARISTRATPLTLDTLSSPP